MTTILTGSPDEPARCRNRVFDEDGEDVCECGDEGRACTSCEAREAAYWSWLWAGASPWDRDLERYEQDMRDAGRGHLLPP